MGKLWGVLESDIGRLWAVSGVKLNLVVEAVVLTRDVDRAREDEHFKEVETSAYECVWLFVKEKKSLIKKRRSIQDRTG